MAKTQKTVQFDDAVMEALTKQMKVSKNGNFSAIVNDGLRYAMFPEHRNDRDADLVKLYNQFSSSLAMHRKKTARDLAFIQELMLEMTRVFFVHHNDVPDDQAEGREAKANARLDAFMETIIRNMGDLKPLSDRED